MNKRIKDNESLASKKIDDLSVELDGAKKDLFGLRYNQATKELKNTSLLRKCKKKIARIKTMISHKMKGMIND